MHILLAYKPLYFEGCFLLGLQLLERNLCTPFNTKSFAKNLKSFNQHNRNNSRFLKNGENNNIKPAMNNN